MQPPRYLEGDRYVSVVAAGVHLARVTRAVGDIVRFLHREPVHIGADQHAPAGAAPPVAQGDERAGAALLEPQLGVLVQVAARRDELSAVDGRQADHTRELGHS